MEGQLIQHSESGCDYILSGRGGYGRSWTLFTTAYKDALVKGMPTSSSTKGAPAPGSWNLPSSSWKGPLTVSWPDVLLSHSPQHLPQNSECSYCCCVFFYHARHPEVKIYLPATWEVLTGELKPIVEVEGKWNLKKTPKSTKTWYLLNMALRNFFYSKVPIHKEKSIDVAHSSIEHFIWSMGINLI